MTIYRIARRMLLVVLLHQETHEHMMDDCGDDLTAATDIWHLFHDTLWSNDFQPELVVSEAKKLLRMQGDYMLGGCDGDIRFSLLTEELLDHYQSIANDTEV